MNTRFNRLGIKSVSLLFVALGACSSSPPATTTVAGDVQFTMAVTVPAGGELYRCQFVTMPSTERYVTAAAHHYTSGSHHLLLYRTDLSTIPAGGDQIQDCYEGLNGSIMSHVRGVVYGSQVPDASFTMPTGVAFHMTSNEVLLLQVHYLNASTKDINASIDVGLTTTTDGSSIQYPAGNLFYYDPFIDVPPNTTAKANARCTLSKDVTLVNVFPHYHSRGSGYQAWLDMPGQPAATSPFYTSTDWEHPASYAGQPLQLPAGTAIRWECDYTNPGSMEYFQGPSAANNEMCMFTGLYYPAVDDHFELCDTAMDNFGVGGATCAQTMTCIQQCPPATSNVSNGQADIPDCVQKCVVNACATASTPLFNALQCIQDKCSTPCNGSDQSACATCVVNNCSTEYGACQSATCN